MFFENEGVAIIQMFAKRPIWFFNKKKKMLIYLECVMLVPMLVIS